MPEPLQVDPKHGRSLRFFRAAASAGKNEASFQSQRETFDPDPEGLPAPPLHVGIDGREEPMPYSRLFHSNG